MFLGRTCKQTKLLLVCLSIVLSVHTVLYSQTQRGVVKFGIDNLIDVKFEPLQGSISCKYC